MSSETSTDAATFRPWHLFVLAGLLASTVGVVVVRPGDIAVLVLLVLAIGSAAGVGLALYRALRPLASPDFIEQIQTVGGRTRAAMEREKTLVLRAIKELEFDRAMSKVSDEDFREMGQRLRAHALTLMHQLDVEMPGYRAEIEKELAQRLGVDLAQHDGSDPDDDADDDHAEAGGDARTGGSVAAAAKACGACGIDNDPDAKFCKGCGSPFEVST
jgi:hypothetical protein